jgi:CHAT domain-containing protein
MKFRALLLLAFCLLWSQDYRQSQDNAKIATDEEDARVATVAARQKAVTDSLTAGNQFHDAGDAVKAARAWNRAGRFQLLLNQPEDAIATYSNALNILGTADPQTRIDSLNGLAKAYERANKCNDASPLLAQAISLSENNAYPEGKAAALLIRPYCMSDRLEALRSGEESLALWKSLNIKLGMARAYSVVGEHQIIQNNLFEAASNYETAKRLWEELSVPNQVAEALINLGFIECRKGEWQASLPFYVQAQQLIVDEAAEPYMMGQIKAGLAEAFVESGLPQTGLDKYIEALEYYRQTKYEIARIGIQWAIGTVHYVNGDYPEALAELNVTRLEALAAKDLMVTGLCDDFLGRTYYEMQDYPAALKHYQAALDEFTQSENPMEAARTVALMGRVYQQQGKLENAKAHYLKALASFRKLSDQVNESATLYALGALALEQNSVDVAEEYLRNSINITERMRRFSRSADLTAAFSAKVHERYEKYIDCKMRKYHASQSQKLAVDAFQTSELARARSLTELLHATQANLFPGLDPELADREKRLREYLQMNESAKLSLLSGRYKTADLRTLEAKQRELEAEHDQVIQEIRARNPSYEEVIQPTAWDLAKIQQQVVADNDTVLLEFSLGAQKSYLWAITRSEIKSYELPNEKQIDELANRVYDLLKGMPSEKTEAELSAAAQSLAQTVLFPAADQLNHHRIIIIPDGSLNYIPFQILPSPMSNEPLVASKEIINAPSASILGDLQAEAAHRQPANNLLAAFGDPVFASDVEQSESADKNDEAVVATARLRSALRDTDLNGDTFDPTAVSRLFNAKRELKSLRDLAGDRALIVSDYDATRQRFLSTDLTQFTILHLVTHGYFNPKHPENSGFVLSNVDRERKQFEGFVGIKEIYEMRTPVLLVVLSACQTALGKDVRGEGLMGVTRGFMHAGASSVVASLWEVDDRATAELMKVFYSNMLQRGMKTGEALREAQNTIRQQPEWRSPHYWAAFTLQGDPQLIQPQIEVRNLGWSLKSSVAVAMLLLVGAIVWYFGLRRRMRAS